MLKKLDKHVMFLAYAYLVFPVILFAAGWLKPLLAIVLAILLCYGVIRAVIDYEDIRPVKIYTSTILIGLFIILGVVYWVYLSGIGGYSFQNADFDLQNAMLRDLIDFDWPVIYNYPTQPQIHELAGHQGALVYYFTYWLPAALLGKVFGLGAANVFLYLWTVWGILLCFYWLSRKVKKLSVFLLLLFIFWSGLDVAGYFAHGFRFTYGEHLEWWPSYFQYSSNTTALFWVHHQVVAPWIIVMLLVNRISKKTVFFTYALCLPYAPFSFAGLTPFVIYYIVSGKNAKKIFSKEKAVDFPALWHNLKANLSVSNLVTAPILIGVFLLFFANTGSRFGGLIWDSKGPYNYLGFKTDLWTVIINYLLFCLLEFGIYVLLIGGKYKKNPVFLIMVASLLLIPSFKMGIYNDFVMRVSIPALTFLLVFVAKFFTDPSPKGTKTRILKYILFAFLLVGAVTPFNEIYRSADATGKNPQGIINGRWHTLSTLEDLKTSGIGNFVAKDPRDRIFFKYLGK
ncbi:MAG: hypothetical protein K6U80_05560 [Firmicutes bacterium]|nr:hypothetical protein [Bacillota bacterium]